MKWERCPTSCLFDPEDQRIAQFTCAQCRHAEDIKVDPPIKARSKHKPWNILQIVGINRDTYYVEQKTTDGRKSTSSVTRDSVDKI